MENDIPDEIPFYNCNVCGQISTKRFTKCPVCKNEKGIRAFNVRAYNRALITPLVRKELSALRT